MKYRLVLVLSLFFGLFRPTAGLQAQNVFENVVSFDKIVHNFGDIMLSDGKMTCSFKMKNVSQTPVVIHRVITSCGCTEPSWTRTPIRPGETGEIRIVFLNDQGPYPFSKSVTVYVAGLSKPVILKIKGIAHDRPKSLKELFPVACGPVGFREKKVSMGQIEQGLSRSIEVELANLTGKTQDILLEDLTPGMTVAGNRLKLAPSSKQRVVFTVNTAATSGDKWGKTPFTFTLTAGGKKYPQALVIEPLIKENFTSMTEAQRRAASLPQFESSSLEFGTVQAGKELEGDYRFRNVGKQPFVIYKTESSEPGVTVTHSDSVDFGERGTVHVKIGTRGQKPGEMLNILTLITNSPTRPIINLFIIYNVGK